MIRAAAPARAGAAALPARGDRIRLRVCEDEKGVPSMLRTLRAVGPLALAALLAPTLLSAQAQGRVKVTVVDEQGQPVPGVAVTITSTEVGYHKEVKTDKKGQFAVIFVDATRIYSVRLEKEGHETVDESIDPAAGGNIEKEFVLPSKGSGAAGGATETGPVADPAVNAFNEGVSALQAGDRETAKQKFRRAMELNSRLPEAPAVLAGLAADEGDAEQALAMAERALALDPDNTRALRVQHDVYRQRGDKAKADAVLERMKLAEGGTETAIRIFNEGAEAARLGDLDAARARFEEALGVDPELAAAHAALARIHFAQEHWEPAIAAAEKAYELDPGQASVLKVAYEAYRRQGDAEGARRVFEEMSRADPVGVASALYESGVQMFNAGNMAGAQQALEQALEANPDLPKAHYTLGLAYANTGDNAKAKEHLQRFLELAPDDPDAATAREMLAYLS